MRDLQRILALWRELETAGTDYVLATVVQVEGPSYRKPGALMLLAGDGRRAGTVSGGCLEAEVASRAWWLTAAGPSIQRYSTADEEDERPYGSGCGGVIFLLLERRNTAGQFLSALDRAFEQRIPLGVATMVSGPELGSRAFAGLGASVYFAAEENEQLRRLAEQVLAGHESKEGALPGYADSKAWADYRAPRPGLAIFGAGDDAQPLLRMARELGWFTSVSDGRIHLATRERFFRADELNILPIEELPNLEQDALPRAFADLRPQDAAVVMTHSFEQDSKILASLLALKIQPSYIGVLGPQRRTRELLTEAARLLGLAANAVQGERWLAQLHAPTGLDLGAESPETIALSVLAEIQKSRTSATALPLRTLRAAGVATAG